MLKLCQLAHEDDHEEDASGAAAITIIYEGELRRAELCQGILGLNFPITKEILTKYRERIGVWISKSESDNIYIQDMVLIAVGYKFLNGLTPEELLAEYPYRSTIYSGVWEIHMVDAADEDPTTPHRLVIKHLPSKTSFKIDKTLLDDRIRLTDPVANNVIDMTHEGVYLKSGGGHAIELSGGMSLESKLRIQHADGHLIEAVGNLFKVLAADGGGIENDASGNLILKSGSGQTLELAADGLKYNGQYLLMKPFLDWFTLAAPTLCLGNLGAPAPLAPPNVATLTAQSAIPGNFTSNLPGVPLPPIPPPEEPDAPEEEE